MARFHREQAEYVYVPIGRKYKRYGCPESQITDRILAWYRANHTTAAEVWSTNPKGRLLRQSDQVTLRARMVLELCVLPEEKLRISPLDVARDAGAGHSAAFMISLRVVQRRDECDCVCKISLPPP